MQSYVAGFLFDVQGSHVALIEKQRPNWQKGQLTGIGGHIEKHTAECIFHNPPPCDIQNFEPCNCSGETPDQAMRREFKEETGVDIDRWMEYVVVSSPGGKGIFFHVAWEVHFFHAYGNEIDQVKIHLWSIYVY